MRLEHRQEKVATFSKFIARIGKYAMVSFALVAVSVLLGTLGYRYIANLSWIDSFYMACMILTGMGPITTLEGTAPKLFSSLYALYSGVAFLSFTAVLFAPFIHRLLHILNIDLDEKK